MIEFKMEMNKEENSLCKIIKGDNQIALTESELETLVSTIYNLRPDVFERLPFNSTIDKLRREIEYLRESEQNETNN